MPNKTKIKQLQPRYAVRAIIPNKAIKNCGAYHYKRQAINALLTYSEFVYGGVEHTMELHDTRARQGKPYVWLYAKDGTIKDVEIKPRKEDRPMRKSKSKTIAEKRSYAEYSGFTVTATGYSATCDRCGKKYGVSSGLCITRHWLIHQLEDKQKAARELQQDTSMCGG